MQSLSQVSQEVIRVKNDRVLSILRMPNKTVSKISPTGLANGEIPCNLCQIRFDGPLGIEGSPQMTEK